MEGGRIAGYGLLKNIRSFIRLEACLDFGFYHASPLVFPAMVQTWGFEKVDQIAEPEALKQET